MRITSVSKESANPDPSIIIMILMHIRFSILLPMLFLVSCQIPRPDAPVLPMNLAYVAVIERHHDLLGHAEFQEYVVRDGVRWRSEVTLPSSETAMIFVCDGETLVSNSDPEIIRLDHPDHSLSVLKMYYRIIPVAKYQGLAEWKGKMYDRYTWYDKKVDADTELLVDRETGFLRRVVVDAGRVKVSTEYRKMRMPSETSLMFSTNTVTKALLFDLLPMEEEKKP